MFDLCNKEQFEKEIENCKINNPNGRHVFRLSRNYLLRSLIFIFLIIFMFSYNVQYLKSKNIIALLLFTIIGIYVAYYLYKIFSYKVVVENGKIKHAKRTIIISEIESLRIVLSRVSNRKLERCFEITDSKNIRYIFRLNISKNIRFIKLIMLLSGKDLEIQG